MKTYNFKPLYAITGTGPVSFKIGSFINSDIRKVWENACKCDKVEKYFTHDAKRDLDREGEVLWIWGKEGTLINVLEVIPQEKIVFEWNGYMVDYKVKTEFFFESKGHKVLFQIRGSGWDMDEKGVKSALVSCNGWSDFINSLKIFTEHNISYMNR